MAKKAIKKKNTSKPKAVKKAKKVEKKPAVKKKHIKKAPVKKALLKKQKPVKKKNAVKKADVKKAVPTKKELTKTKKIVSAPASKQAKEIKNTIPKPEVQNIAEQDTHKPLKVTVKSGPKKPEPKGKYVIEFSVKSSIPILFEFISTPSGLSEWFSDNVSVQTGGFFTFYWDGVPQQAKLIGYRDQEYIRFEWVDKKDGSFFEFRIETDELTSDVSLFITDFADPSELQTNKLVWGSQIDDLLHIIGSYGG